jgi:CRISPR-associated protein Csm3
VCRVFGNAHTGLPSILLVRDALYTTETKRDYIESKLPITEAKIEIAVDRITAQALPRTIERVPAGARFDFSMVYRVQQDENRPNPTTNVKEDLTNILEVLEDIEKFDGLGGNTARGHGQVKFHLKPLRVMRYRGGQKILEIPCDNLGEAGFCSLGDLKNKLSDPALNFA